VTVVTILTVVTVPKEVTVVTVVTKKTVFAKKKKSQFFLSFSIFSLKFSSPTNNSICDETQKLKL
jgi:hypothetical protein